MKATVETPTHAPADPAAVPSAAAEAVARMTKVQKLAALLIILGSESASLLLKELDQHELEAVCAETSKLTMLSRDVQSEVMKEFSGIAVHASTSLRGGIEFTQGTLERAVGLFKASGIINRVAPQRAPSSAIQQLIDLETRQLFNLLKSEQPQTIALVTSYLAPERASEILMLLREDLRDRVVERLATLAPTPIEVVERIVEVMTRRLTGGQSRVPNQTGGVKSAASLLNALDKNISKALLTTIEERNPELGLSIRQKMFTFEDLRLLEQSGLQRILREVDMRDLAVSLKTCSEELKKRLLGCISKRAAETVAEEISLMGSLKLKDIEAAQLRVIETVRRLESEGEIELGDSSKEGTS